MHSLKYLIYHFQYEHIHIREILAEGLCLIMFLGEFIYDLTS